jgi:predicted flavoprotein YhiN
MGHTIRRPRPALVPLTSDEAWVRELSGITIPDVRLQVVDPQSDARPGSRRRRGSLPPGVLIERRGSLLFTHFGLSGPVVLDVSRAITGSTNPPSVVLLADFLPGSTAEELEAACSKSPHRRVGDWSRRLSPRSCRADLSSLCWPVQGYHLIAELRSLRETSELDWRTV